MTNRSSAISLALLFAPTLCVVAIRFGLPALEEVISQDSVLEFSIHIGALCLGALMLYRFQRVEDHEFHRSQAIRRLSKTYKSEDRGLWEEKSDRALERLEIKASSSNRRINSKVNKRMSGKVGGINSEMEESEVDEGYEPEVRVSGLQTIVDEENLTSEKEQKNRFSISIFISSYLDNSARRRLLKKKRKEEKTRIKNLERANKISSKDNLGDSLWDAAPASRNVRSVLTCNHCGVMNNSDSQYCTSCGNYLIS
ncbi:MAG TPA: hypothetical protein HA315_05185 [Candidatus Thalassarchaeaceae archaeon]|nr:MAG TPA: hypothetical protein D7H72_05160 [Candidatus Poseidoniales archaeon]HII35372.1 hypothetical protein [Candidatus Thalassarchaeaceae archaeon]